MKYWIRIPALVALLIAPSCCGAADAPQLVPARIQSVLAMPRLPASPAIDGRLDDAAWQRAQPLKITTYKSKVIRYPTHAWIGRDDTHFYIGARCFDDKLDELVTKHEGSLMWRNDCLEIFIVPERNELYWTKLTVVCDGRYDGSTWVPDEWGEPVAGEKLMMEVKTGRERDAWTAEIAIPVKPFGLSITPESVWALGLNREKWTEPKEVSSFLGGFNRPKEYPDLVFDGRTVVFDGVGLRNIGDQPKSVTARLVWGDTRKTTSMSLKPGETAPINWRQELGDLAGEQELGVEVLAGDGAVVAREAYRLVPPAKTIVKVDPHNLPEPQFRPSPFDDPSFFPISVRLQPAGSNVVASYKEIGVNVYFGGIDSYPRPRDKDWLDNIHAAGMYAVIAFKQKYVDSELYKHPAVIGWHHGDEPDLIRRNGSIMSHEALLSDLAKMRAVQPNLRVFLNSSTIVDGASVQNTMGSRVDCLVKRHEKSTYLFCVNMFRKPEKPVITVKGVDDAEAEVLLENRTVRITDGKLVDEFAPYAVHRYRIR